MQNEELCPWRNLPAYQEPGISLRSVVVSFSRPQQTRHMSSPISVLGQITMTDDLQHLPQTHSVQAKKAFGLIVSRKNSLAYLQLPNDTHDLDVSSPNSRWWNDKLYTPPGLQVSVKECLPLF
ncbi:Uncharacterised protein r2_g23 [Pycnogonum litorale]